MGPWYCTREDVKSALDVKLTARNDVQIDRAIESASRAVEGLLHRRFYPEVDTRYFSWPNRQMGTSYRLWLDNNELVSVTSLVAAGTTIAASDYFLEPTNFGPPYNRVELDLGDNATFGGGDTHQRSVQITGVFGYNADTEAAGALAEALDDSETGVDVTNSAAVGVGDLILVESERMQVTGKSMLDTAVDTSNALEARDADVSVTMSTTAGAPAAGETILVDSERMLVVDVSGSTLTVKRAWDGSTLAAHSSGASILAPRTLIVTRGVLGTTAASHDIAAAVARHVVPGPVRTLCVAEALAVILGEQSGYARVVGQGDNSREATGRGLAALRKQVVTSHGRKSRIRAV